MSLLMVGMKRYCFVLKRILVRHTNQEYFALIPNWRLLPRVLSSIYSAKTTYAQLPDIPLRSGTQALRLIARIPLLSSGGKSIVLAKKKVPSLSGFSLSTHVVLKTRYVSPNIHVRRY